MSQKRGHFQFFGFKIFDSNIHMVPAVGLIRPALNRFTKKNVSTVAHCGLLIKEKVTNVLETKPL